jgi:CBS domain-containing protein
VFTIEQAATLADAVKLLAERNIGALIVADVSGQIAGIISERDIVRALHEKGTAVLGSPVAGTMTRKVVTCTDAAEVTEITERMTEGKFRHVPVAEHGRLAGIVSIGDVVKARLEELENKLMNVEAVTASIAHEVRQPLAAIAAYGGAALRFLQRAPPDLEEVQSALNAITNDSHRASTVFDSIRALFKSNGQGQESIDVNEIALGVLRILSGELKEHCITVRTELGLRTSACRGP